MAMLAATGVRFEEWLRFASWRLGLLVLLGMVGLLLAIALGV